MNVFPDYPPVSVALPCAGVPRPGSLAALRPGPAAQERLTAVAARCRPAGRPRQASPFSISLTSAIAIGRAVISICHGLAP